MTTLSISNLDLAVAIGGQHILAMRDVSFEVGAGEILGVIGESGAGKSMIGRLLGRLLPPQFKVTRGEMIFKGENLRHYSPEMHRSLLGRQICFIPQEPRAALDPIMSIGAQFHEHLKHNGIQNTQTRQQIALAALESVQMPEPAQMLKRFAHQLSGGQCQRVLIAMAFASKPDLIIADEPTTALDALTQAVIVDLLKRMCREHGTAAVLITHDLKMAMHVCDKMVVLYAGEVVESGSAHDLQTAPRHPYTRALQLVNPPLAGERFELVSLPGHMPSLGNLPQLGGCRFAPRCAYAQEQCHQSPVIMHEVNASHHARCVLVENGVDLSEHAYTNKPLDLTSHKQIDGAPVLEVSGLSKQFRQSAGLFRPKSVLNAVKDFNLTLQKGEFVGIVGQSGSGKSTVARMLVGLETPTHGEVKVDGHSVVGESQEARKRRIENIQMVFQDPQSALNPRRQLGDIVTYAMSAGEARFSEAERMAKARQLLTSMGLGPEMVSRYPSQLSGGQRQRVNIARALCQAPRILVADEILSGLDVSVQAQILGLLLTLRRETDISLILISHDIAAVRYLCTRIVVMHRGNVVESGLVDDVLSNPQHAYTRSLINAIPPDDVNIPWPQVA